MAEFFIFFLSIKSNILIKKDPRGSKKYIGSIREPDGNKTSGNCCKKPTSPTTKPKHPTYTSSKSKSHVMNTIEYSTSMGVSLLSEAATSVSMFKAEPNPALSECYLSIHTDIGHNKNIRK